MIATLPHFYKAEQLLDGIESGLEPNKSFHELYVHLEIVSLASFVKIANLMVSFGARLVDRCTGCCRQKIAIQLGHEAHPPNRDHEKYAGDTVSIVLG